MLKWLRLNGTDFNVEVSSSLSFEEFVKEGEHSFSRGKSRRELMVMHETLVAASLPVKVKEVPAPKKVEDGNSTGTEEKITGITGKRTGSGNRSDQS